MHKIIQLLTANIAGSSKVALLGVGVALLLAGGCGSAATPSPAIPLLPPLASGGLGLTKAAWELRHQQSLDQSHSSVISYDDDRCRISFWHPWPQSESDDNAPISGLDCSTKAKNIVQAQVFAKTLIPTDAVLLEQKTLENRHHPDQPQLLETYHSAALIDRYAPLPLLSQSWAGLPAGTFYVEYPYPDGSQVWIAVAGTAVPPRPPQPTDTPCPGDVCPTRTPVPPVPTAIRPLPASLGTIVPTKALPNPVATLTAQAPLRK